MLTSHKKGKENLIKMHTHSIRNRSTCFLFLNTCTSTTTCMLIYIGCVCKEKNIQISNEISDLQCFNS